MNVREYPISSPIMRSTMLRRILLVVVSVGLCCAGVVGVEAFASYRVRQTAWNIRGYRGRVLGAKLRNEIPRRP